MGLVSLANGTCFGRSNEILTFSKGQKINKHFFNRQVAARKFFSFSHCKINTHQQFEIKGKIRPQFYTCLIVFQKLSTQSDKSSLRGLGNFHYLYLTWNNTKSEKLIYRLDKSRKLLGRRRTMGLLCHWVVGSPHPPPGNFTGFQKKNTVPCC